MSGGGPGSREPGPPSSSEAEALRRRLYGPGGLPAQDLDRYERLVAAPGGTTDDEEPVADRADEPTPGPDPSTAAPFGAGAPPRRRTRRRAGIVVAAVVVCVAVAAVLSLLGPHPLPHTVPLPPPSGTTLLFHSRVSDPASVRSATTFTTADYTLLDPRGRRVGVALRCIGEGRVRIFAGTRFDFRCSDRESLQRRSTPAPVRTPFVVYGLTTGNVVWSVRIVRE